MNRLLSLGFLFVAAIASISIATKYSRGVAFRSQDLPADEAGYPAETHAARGAIKLGALA